MLIWFELDFLSLALEVSSVEYFFAGIYVGGKSLMAPSSGP